MWCSVVGCGVVWWDDVLVLLKSYMNCVEVCRSKFRSYYLVQRFSYIFAAYPEGRMIMFCNKVRKKKKSFYKCR